MTIKQPSRIEFIALMAAMISLDAFSIDAMIPALNHISSSMNVVADNHRQYVVTSIFLGFAAGVLVYGLVSDAIGRKKPIITGFILYGIGVVVCISATNFEVLLLGRVLQGFGVAGPYVLSLAIIRDTYSGTKMAQIMSFVMMVFIVVPIIAPLIGQGILMVSNWRGIFFAMGVFALLILIWFCIRQSETLKPEYQTQLNLSNIWRQAKQVFSHPQSLKFLFALGMVLGAFITYLSTSQQIFQEIYQLGNLFPVVFASISAALGISSYFNSRWTDNIELRKLIQMSLLVITSASMMMILFGTITNANPPLIIFMLYMACVFFCYGLLFGNITTLALEPMGHIAGSASSIVTAVSTLISIVLAAYIGSQLEHTVYPVVLGFGILSFVALLINLKPKTKYNAL